MLEVQVQSYNEGIYIIYIYILLFFNKLHTQILSSKLIEKQTKIDALVSVITYSLCLHYLAL